MKSVLYLLPCNQVSFRPLETFARVKFTRLFTRYTNESQ